MTEPKEFQGMQRAELVRLVVRYRELREQAAASCERLRGILIERTAERDEIHEEKAKICEEFKKQFPTFAEWLEERL